MKLKVCGMKYKDNIQGLISLNPEYIGFIFYPKSPRYIGGDFEMPEIPSSTKKTGIFVNESFDTISSAISKYNLNAVQLHGSETPELCKQLMQLKIEVIKAFSISESSDLNKTHNYNHSCDFFLFDTKTKLHGGSGQKFDWNILNEYDNEKPIFLSGGITKYDSNNIKRLHHLNIYCVDVNSGFEDEPGLKKIQEVGYFRKAIRNNVFIDIASEHDLEEILNIQKQAFLDEAAIYGHCEVSPLRQDMQSIKEQYKSQVFLKAVINDKIVGSVRAQVENNICEIQKLSVLQESQGMSIGQMLMLEAENIVNDVDKYTLHTAHKSDKNIYLYKKIGYQEIGREKASELLTMIFFEKINTRK